MLGNLRGWRWANAWWFRLLHALAIATVVAESWLGIACPLTTLEQWLRVRGGGAAHGAGFLQHALQSLLYWDAPAWVFTVAYTVFGLLVAMTWLLWPPQRKK